MMALNTLRMQDTVNQWQTNMHDDQWYQDIREEAMERGVPNSMLLQQQASILMALWCIYPSGTTHQFFRMGTVVVDIKNSTRKCHHHH